MLELIITVGLLYLFTLPFALIGLFLFIQIARGKKLPMDESNRINHIRLVWFSLTRPELFVGTFEWLKHDELDNVKDKQ
jgi:hypothetical protein